MRAGVAARAGGYIAMFVLVVLAGGLAAKRVPRLMARASIVAIITAAVGGAYFAVSFPTGGLGSAHSIGLGIVLFAGAILLGIGAAVFTLRMPEPARP
jgi:hypothetical protein